MFAYGRAICYSGYREGQSPGKKIYPNEQQVLEDLTLLSKHFDYIRMYDPYMHAQTVLKVISEHKIPLKLMLGCEPGGEISNPSCEWGGTKTNEEIERNKVKNYEQLDLLANLCNRYEDIIIAAAVGNENTSDWHHNLMDPKVIANHVRYLKSKIKQPVTFCEGWYYWHQKGDVIAKEVDFIAIHSYPMWLKIPVKQAFEATKHDYEKNKAKYPNKPIIFTELGWTTMANDRMLNHEATEENQKMYLDDVVRWSEKNKITMFLFEAFDEPWKGSDQPNEPEKHWGIYTVKRQPKLFAKKYL